ncbi:hypothetical protein H9P43_000966 [Blastocladiella emersonii ATCC 22665]|nr:hypothetical protein H9P43_000966 [Blastocladiella emersonii ATCC 22665]
MHLSALRALAGGALLAVLLLALAAAPAHAAELQLRDDPRAVIAVSAFGFAEGGQFNLTVSRFAVHTRRTANTNNFVGLLLRSTSAIEDDTMEMVEQYGLCPVDARVVRRSDVVLDLRNASVPFNYVHRVKDGEAGYWTGYLVNCNQLLTMDDVERAEDDMDMGELRPVVVDLDLHYTAVNPPNSLLDIGLAPMPRVYFIAAVYYTVILGKFVHLLRVPDAQVLRIHWMMLAFVALLVVDKVFVSVQYYSLSQGVDAKGWDWAAYIFTFIKSSLAVSIVALIGAGWSFVRPILPAKERKLILWIIPLQLAANVARVLLETLAMGSMGWSVMAGFFPLFDLLSFLLILWTILSTRRHLLEAAAQDAADEETAKAAATMAKLKLWGWLYVSVVVYLYATRILATFMVALLPYTHTWVAEVFAEGVSAWFYTVLGYKFRPCVANPYTEVLGSDEGFFEDDEDEETPRERPPQYEAAAGARCEVEMGPL